MIGINLPQQHSVQMRDLCSKYGNSETHEVFVPSESEIGSLNAAFGAIAARISVSATFELDDVLTDY